MNKGKGILRSWGDSLVSYRDHLPVPSDTKHSISERNIGNKGELFAWESRSSSYAGRKLQQVETKTQSTGKEGRPPANEPMSYTSSSRAERSEPGRRRTGHCEGRGCRAAGGRRTGGRPHENLQGLGSTAGDPNQHLGTWPGHLCFEALCAIRCTRGAKNQ